MTVSVASLVLWSLLSTLQEQIERSEETSLTDNHLEQKDLVLNKTLWQIVVADVDNSSADISFELISPEAILRWMMLEPSFSVDYDFELN